MNKKINWDQMYKAPKRRLNNNPSKPGYGSGKEMLAKAVEREKAQTEIQENFQKALPALQALLKCRMESHTPIEVKRDFRFMASDIVHNRAWNYETESYDGEVLGSTFQDVVKSVPIGSRLILKSLDPNLQEFIFENQKGEEVVVPFSAKNQLMTMTDIYENTIAFMQEKGER